MRRRKDIILVLAGILIGIVISSPAAQAALTASTSTQIFYLAGEKIGLEAYSINGANYVKLRDIGRAVDFAVDYDAAANSVHIDPDAHYSVPPAVPTPATGAAGGLDECALLANGKPITEENVLEMLHQIQRDWPTGTVWGTHNTPGTHKNEIPSTEGARIMRHYGISNEYGCGAYASMVSSLIFGDRSNPARQVDDLMQIRPGDIVFWVNNTNGSIWHVVVALESPNDIHAFHTTDGNNCGRVEWPDPQSPYSRLNIDCYRGELATHHLDVWTRYPESVPSPGNSAGAWSEGH